MKLVAPRIVKMHINTLEQGIEYSFGRSTGNIYVHEKFRDWGNGNFGEAVEKNPQYNHDYTLFREIIWE